MSSVCCIQKSLIGFKTTSKDHTRIILENQPAINNRLTALDIGYHHLQAIENAGISGYTVSGTAFSNTQARLALLESGFEEDNDFKVNVLVQEEYERLSKIITEMWQNTFDGFGLSFQRDMEDSEGIADCSSRRQHR